MNPHILVVDDQESILDGFAALLDPNPADAASALDELEAALGGTPLPSRVALPSYSMHYARQGADAVRICAAAIERKAPLSVAFVDIHMPPGMDGVETALALWRLQPDLEIVLCSAHSIYSWQEIFEKLPRRDQLVVLRKPFDAIEVRQLAACLGEKVRRGREIQERITQLETLVQTEVARRMHSQIASAEKFEELGRLAAGIAHEISTPTQYIQSSLDFIDELVTEMVESPAEPIPVDEIRSAVRDALHGVGRVTAIVRSVREYSHGTTELEPVDLNHQVRLAAELSRSQYKYDAELSLELGDVPIIQGHADEIGRAIMNLMVNAAHAIRAKGAGMGTIAIRTHVTTDAITLSVRDTGTGIAPEHQARVFEPFFTTKPRGEGTGQGLPLVRAAVEHHHGTIRFETTPGEGTTFILAFPLEKTAASVAA